VSVCDLFRNKQSMFARRLRMRHIWSTLNRGSSHPVVRQICANCGTTNTPLWRKEAGQHMCNACCIYYKNHGYHRSMDLAKAPSRNTGGGGSHRGGGSHAGSAAGRQQATWGGLSCEVGSGFCQEDTATSPLARNAKYVRSEARPSCAGM
jgi:hypothetical protein